MSSIIDSLADALRAGTVCDFTSEADRSISSSDFADLVGGRGTVALNEMHPRGLRSKGLHVTGDIDWSFDRWCSVRLDECTFDSALNAAGLRVDGELHVTNAQLAGIKFADARIDGDLSFSDSVVGGEVNDDSQVFVDLNSITVNGTLHMSRMTIRGDVNLGSADIQFGAAFNGSILAAAGKWFSLNLGDSEIQGIVSMNINLYNSIIGGLNAVGAVLQPSGLALDATNLTSKSTVALNGLTATGGLNFGGAKISGQLSLNGARLTSTYPEVWALSTFQATISGGVWMNRLPIKDQEPRNFTASGGATFASAKLESLTAEGAKFLNPDGTSFSINGTMINGDCNLMNATFEGQIDMSLATLEAGGNFDNTTITAKGIAIVAENFCSKAHVTLCGLTATGGLNFHSAAISGQLVLNGAQITSTSDSKWALNAFQATITGGVWMSRLPIKNQEPRNFTASGGATFARAKLGALSADGATFLRPDGTSLSINGTMIDGDCFLTNATFEGGIDMSRATLEAGGSFNNTTITAKGVALSANNFSSKANVTLHGLTATGGLNFHSAAISGQLVLNGAQLTSISQSDWTLNGFQATITGGVWMNRLPIKDQEPRSFKASGGTTFASAKLGSLSAEGAEFLNPDGTSLSINGTLINGDCTLTDATFEGGLNAADVIISKRVLMRVATSNGLVNFGGSNIGSQVEIGGKFRGVTAVDFSTAQIDSSFVFLADFLSVGLVRIETAEIKRSLLAKAGAKFYPFATTITQESSDIEAPQIDDQATRHEALKWNRTKVKGRIKFAHLDTEKSSHGDSVLTVIAGDIAMENMEVGEDINFNYVSFEGCNLLDLKGSKIGKNLQFGTTNSAPPRNISLRGVSVDELCDTPEFWGLQEPARSRSWRSIFTQRWTSSLNENTPNVDLVDFTYKRFGIPDSLVKDDLSPISDDESGLGTMHSVHQRLAWLGIQTRKAARTFPLENRVSSYVPQPYQQLADVYRAMGRDGERRQVLITQQDDLRKFGEMTRATKTWNRFMSTFAAHGYRPLRSFGLTMAIFLLSVVCVWIPKHNDAFVASVAPVTHWKVQGNSMDFTEFPKSSHCTSEYPCLNEWLYTLDAVIPVVDLQQTPYWSFDKSFTVGWLFQILFALLTVFGWISTSIFVIVISGIVSKE
jgi:hypothetical protein